MRRPAAEVLLVDVVNGEVEVHCRFWTGSRGREATAARDHAIAAVATEHDVALPADQLGVELTAGDKDDRDREHVGIDGQWEP